MNAFCWDTLKGNVPSRISSFLHGPVSALSVLLLIGGALISTTPAAAQDSEPRMLFVDARYRGLEGRVGFPYGNPDVAHYIGRDAFSDIQAAVNGAPTGGIVYIAAGTY